MQKLKNKSFYIWLKSLLKKGMTFLFFIMFYMLTTEMCTSDIITLQSGQIHEGKIRDVTPDQLLFEAKQDKGTCVFSFNKKDIDKIKLKPFEFPEKYIILKLASFRMKVGIRIFDELIREKGSSFFGTVEIETPQVVYFSLLLEDGIGIVGFDRNEIVGIEGSRGFGKLLGKFYFRFRYFLYDLRIFVKEIFLKINPSTVGDKPIYEWMKEMGLNGSENTIGGRKIFTLRSLKSFLGGYYSLGADERYNLGAKEGFLILGMNHDQVKSILGDTAIVSIKNEKEYWNYPNKFEVTFHNGRLIGYTKKNRGKILEDTNLFFGDKITKK